MIQRRESVPAETTAAAAFPAATAVVFPRCRGAASLDAACAELTDELAALGYELPSVYLLIDGRLRCQAARGYFQVVDGHAPGVGIIGRAVLSGTPVVVSDVASEPGFIAAIPGIAAEACVPVTLDGKVVGAVNVESRDVLPTATVATLQAAAESLTAWLDGHGGMPQVPPAQRLARIALQLSSSTDAPSIVDRALVGAIELSGMDTGMLVRRSAGERWTRWARGPLAPHLLAWADDVFVTFARWVAAGTSSHFPGGEAPPSGYEFLTTAGVRSLTIHPLVAAGSVTGLLIVADRDPVPHDPALGVCLELLAAKTASSLGMAEAIADLKRQAVQDPLTGCPNAAAFVAHLDRDARNAAPASATQRCLMLLDVDAFKAVNDAFGHLAGDRLLRSLADELAGELRPQDTLYRVGGDEFAALVDVHSVAEAEAIAQRLVAAARRVRTTVSIGVTLLAAPGTDPEDARSRADVALYQAKDAGRDTYRLAEG